MAGSPPQVSRARVALVLLALGIGSIAPACSDSDSASAPQKRTTTTSEPTSLSSRLGEAVSGTGSIEQRVADVLADDGTISADHSACAAKALLQDVGADQLAEAFASLDGTFLFESSGSPSDQDAWFAARDIMRCEPESIGLLLSGLGLSDGAVDCAQQALDDDLISAAILLSYDRNDRHRNEARKAAAALVTSESGGAVPASRATNVLMRQAMGECLGPGDAEKLGP